MSKQQSKIVVYKVFYRAIVENIMDQFAHRTEPGFVQ
jgi:hypothetical protein